MPDYNKGDFTQQGVNGHVNATVRLNEKRLVSLDLTSNEVAEGCTIAGTVKDLLNDKVYNIGSGVSGNIEITENGENINVAPYATATVNVESGSGFVNPLIHFNITFENDVTACDMWLEPATGVMPNPPIDFAFLVDSENKLLTAPQLDVFFDSETPFEWGLSLISTYYLDANSIWILAVTADSETQEIKSVTSSDCTVMFTAPTFACSIPDGQSEATVNITIGNTTPV